MAQPLLELLELSKYYVNGQNVAAGLNKVSLSFEQGEFVAITGESGSGKSSLAHILGGILPYEDGELLLEGRPTSHYDSADWERYRADRVGFISQNYGILPGATVLENVVSALRLTGMDKELAVQEARSILEEVELWELRRRRAAKLSSGQKQRLSIARALAKPCTVLIADEPTGNLDPENSDKVIRLLAKAARDRLVILITHEFSEAEDYVTRHISLQDGRVCADARLRAHAPAAGGVSRRKPLTDLSRYIAALQVRSRPAWSIVVLVFAALTAFAVFAFLGSFAVALDDTSTRIYDSSAFLNGEKTRIVAVRSDLQPMTQADYDAILAMKHVHAVEKFGYVKDISYAWQEDEDYVINYVRYNYGTLRTAEYIEIPAVEFLKTDRYVQTVPLMASGEGFLSAGRLPGSFYEVVAAGDESLLGTQHTVYLRDTVNWALGGSLQLNVTVVGVTEQGSGLYFHDDVARTLTLNYLGAEYVYMPTGTEIPVSAEYVNYREARSKVMYGAFCPPFYAYLEPARGSKMRPMEEHETLISLGLYVDLLTEDPTADYRRIYNKALRTDNGVWNTAGLHESTLENMLAVTPERFAQIMAETGMDCGNQVNITVTDYAYAQRVIEELDQSGYFALSPYIIGAAQIDPDLAAQRVRTLLICAGALIVVILLQLIVLRAMFGMETESYRVLSDMGLTFRTARRSILLQVLGFAAAGLLLSLAAVFVCSMLDVERITAVTRYLYGPWWIVIALVHIGSNLLAVWPVTVGLRKKIYPRTAALRDLQIEEEAEQ